MEIITILLVSDDIDYANTLASCVANENKSIIFNIIVSADIYDFKSLNEYSLILLDKSILCDENVLKVLVEKDYLELVDTLDENDLDELNSKKIYKYDTAESISKKLTIMFCLKTGCNIMYCSNKKIKLIYFCSSAGGTGKTSIALGLAQDLVRFHGKKVLYVNNEEIESTNRYFINDDKKTMSNYLYYIEANKKLTRLVDEFTITDEYGVKSFSASKGRNPLKILNIEELARLIEIIQNNANLDYIFIDGDNTLTKESVWLTSISDIICIIEKYNNDIKEDNYINYLLRLLGTQVDDKILYVTNFYHQLEEGDKQLENECFVENEKEKIYIDYDLDSFVTGKNNEDKLLTKINIDRAFGIGIRQLSTELTLILQ